MLFDHVLVLNQNYEPLLTCSVRRAIVLLFLGKATMVEPRNGKKIRSVSRIFAEPSIVRLQLYKRVPFKAVMLNRKNVIRRDNGRCQYCGATDRAMTVDHVIPRLRGGKETWDNLVCACEKCNNRKGDNTPAEVDMVLFRAPRRPTYLTFMRQQINKDDEIWKKYLFFN